MIIFRRDAESTDLGVAAITEVEQFRPGGRGEPEHDLLRMRLARLGWAIVQDAPGRIGHRHSPLFMLLEKVLKVILAEVPFDGPG
ncbi:MAG: hypothetical protein NTU53_01010 [Planctomycetota bacterium]|nr:hypothetical protein [Planctomycetota bacterium]